MNEDTAVDLSSELGAIAENLGFTTQEDGNAEETNQTQPEEVGEAADASTDDSAEKAEETATETKTTEEPAAAAEEGADQPTATAVPKTWRAEAAAEWEKIPTIVKAEIIKRESDIFAGLEQYRGKAAFADSVSNVLAPFAAEFKQYDLDPVAILPSLLQAHKTLALGTETDRLNMIYDLAHDYGIDLGQDHAPLEQVKALQAQVGQLNFKLEQQQKHQYEALVAERVTEVEAFMKDPQYPHASKVAAEMEKVLASGSANSLKEAYQQAVYLNEATRTELIQAEAQKAAEQRLEQENLKKRRSASKPPQGTVGAGGTATSTDLRTTVADIYDQLVSTQ